MTMTKKQRKRAATAGAILLSHRTTVSPRRSAKRRATVWAVVIGLGVLHLSTKDASGETPPVTPPAVVLAPALQITNNDSAFDPCGDFSTKDICASYQQTHPVAVDTHTAQGCRDEHYDDGTSEIICDTNGVLPTPPLPVKHVPTVKTKLALPETS